MKIIKILLLGFFIALNCISHAEKGPIHVGLPELVAHPDRYQNNLVSVTGFVVFEKQAKHSTTVVLFLNEKSSNITGSRNTAIEVIPNEEMLQSEEQLDHKVINVTAVCHTVRSTDGSYLGVLEGVKHFRSVN